MARRSSRPIGFQFPVDPPAPPAAQRRSLTPTGSSTAPGVHRAREGEACPTCGRDLTPGERLGALRRTPAFAGEEARPSPQGPHAPLPEAEHASSRALRRAGAAAPALSPTRPRGRGAAAPPPGATLALPGLDEIPRVAEPAGVRARSPRPAPAGDLDAIIAALAAEPGRERCLAHVERIPAREARFADPGRAPAREPARGPGRRRHRAALPAPGRARSTRRAAARTWWWSPARPAARPSATTCPSSRRCSPIPQATALYLFPTKALAQDQLKTAQRLADSAARAGPALPPRHLRRRHRTHTRRKLRAEGRLILTNPDMLHAGILPNHTRWARFF